VNLRERALALLARREHSSAELARKLAPHAPAAEIAALVETLRRENLLSDARYAEALARARDGRHGSLRLRADLRAQGVPQDQCDAVLATARARDLEAARALWQRKFGRAPADAADRTRQMRFLAARGYPAEVIRRVVAGADDFDAD
jgi:regulatory protein